MCRACMVSPYRLKRPFIGSAIAYKRCILSILCSHRSLTFAVAEQHTTRNKRERCCRYILFIYASTSMSNTNRGVVYVKPGVVEVRAIPYPSLKNCEHGVILKVVLSAICGSDQHMVRG